MNWDDEIHARYRALFTPEQQQAAESAWVRYEQQHGPVRPLPLKQEADRLAEEGAEDIPF